MSLIRNKSFEKIIKISKLKNSSKTVQIIAAQNKNLNTKLEMVMKVDDYWLVDSEIEIMLDSLILRKQIYHVMMNVYYIHYVVMYVIYVCILTNVQV